LSEPLRHEEVRGLIGAIRGGFAGARDRAFVWTLYSTGSRCNEALMLDLDDVDRTSNPWTIRIRFPKGVARGARPRTVGLRKEARGALECWLRLRGEAPGPLFVTARGKRVDASHYRRLLPQRARAAGISRRVHPHALRHTFARELHDEGFSIRLIQLALGHARLDTTQTYLQGLGDPEVIAMTGGRGDDL